MRRDAYDCTRRDLVSAQRLAIGAWLLVLLVVSARVLLMPGKQSVYPTFARAGVSWLRGANVYLLTDLDKVSCNAFRYSPLAAAALAPLSLLPEHIGEVFWRLLNAGVLLGALAWWWRTSRDRQGAAAVRSLPYGRGSLALCVLSLLLLPLVVGNLNNGQSNPIVLGLLLLSVTAVARRRWNGAAACLAGACFLKLYPLAVGLLLAVVFPRRFSGRLLLFLALGAAAPFVLQRPGYVAAQYMDWARYLCLDDRHAWAAELGYRDLSLLFRVCEVPVSPKAYQLIQLAAAAGAALLCVTARLSRWPKRRLLNGLLALGCIWMTLFGAATESATYLLLAPTLVAKLVNAWPGAGWRRLLLSISYGLLVSTQLASWFPGGATHVQALGPQPLAAFLLLIVVLADWRRDTGRRPAASPSRNGETPCAGRPLYVGSLS
jgi:hypothetical protein